AFSDMIELNNGLIAIDSERAVLGTGKCNLLSVGDTAGREGETFADGGLLLRMNVIFFADVGDDGHPRIGKPMGRQPLRLAELRPITLARLLFDLLKGCELDEKEGK